MNSNEKFLPHLGFSTADTVRTPCTAMQHETPVQKSSQTVGSAWDLQYTFCTV